MEYNIGIPRAYIYLDELGINSLLTQTEKRIKKGSMSRTEKSLSLKIFSISKVDEVNTNFLHDQLTLLMSRMKDRIFFNLMESTQYCHNNRKPAFLLVKEKFDMPQFSKGKNGVDILNEDGAALFKISSHSYKIQMSASLNNFKRIHNGHMGMTSHDAIFFRAFNGKGVPINVFGQIVFLKNISYQIKPYAIWI